MDPPDSEAWERAKTQLRSSLERCLGLERLDPDFAAQCSEYSEPHDPMVAKAVSLWDELSDYRVAPEERTDGSFAAERVTFPGVEGDVVCVLRIPTGLTGLAPAVLCLHSHTRGLMLGKEITEFYAVPLTRAGFVTLCPDAMVFGERRWREFDEREIGCGGQTAFVAEKIAAFEALLNGSTLMGRQLAEYLRCVDFLSRTPEVGDVAVMGHSMGGIHSFWLSALDERISATVCLAGLLSYRLMAEARMSQYHRIYCIVPGLLKLCDTPDIVSLIAPRALYALHARDDLGFAIKGIEEIAVEALRAYRHYDAQDQFVSRIVEGNHRDVLAASHLRDVADWLKAHVPMPLG